jgi:hypothetical protein
MKLKLQTMYGNFNFSYGAHSAIIFTKWIVRQQQPSPMTYVNSHYQSHTLSGSRRLQRTLSVRVSYTQYPPICYVSHEPFQMNIYCYCLIIGMPIDLLVFRENCCQSPCDYIYTGTYFKVQILYIYLFILPYCVCLPLITN